MIAAALELEFSANMARLVSDMGQVKNVVNSTAASVVADMQNAKRAIEALGGAFAIQQIAGFIMRTAEAEEQVGKLSEKIGIAVSDISALKLGLAQNGVTLDEFGMSTKTLAQRLTQASEASSKAGQLFAAMGVNISGGTEPAIAKIADTFAKLPDGATKAALAVELFGKAGMQMIPFLNQGAAGIQAMKDESARLGLVMSEDAVAAARQFTDNMKVMEAGSQRLGITLMNTLAPSLVRVTGAMNQAATDSGILMALWVGLGGAAAEALRLSFGIGAEELEKATSRMRTLSGEIENLKSHIAPDQRNNLLQGLVAPANMIEASFLHASQQAAGLAVYIRAIRGEFDHIEDQVSRRMGQPSLPMPGSATGGKDTSLASTLQAILAGGGAAGRVTADAGLDLYTKLEQEATKLSGQLTVQAQDQTLISTQLELQKKKYDDINPIMQAMIIGWAMIVDAEKQALEHEKFMNDEHQKELDFVAKQGDALEKISNDWADQTQTLQDQLKFMGLSNIEREKAVLLERAREDIVAAGDNASAVRDINDNLTKQVGLLGQIDAKEKELARDKETLNLFVSGFQNVWNIVTDGAGNTATRVRDAFKKTFFDWIYAQAAKPIFLQFIGSLSMGGLSGAANAASGVGGIGNGLSGLGSLFGGGGSIFGTGALTGAGDFAGTGLAGLAGNAALAAGATDAFAASVAAAVPVIGWIVGIGMLAYSIFGSKGGGPKTGGSYYTGGSVPGTDNGRFFTPNQDDASIKTLVDATSSGFMQAFALLGGKGTPGFNFGLGTDSDPSGTAGSRASALLTDATGHSLFDVRDLSTDDVSGTLSLLSQKMILKALQSSDLPKDVKDLLNSVSADTASATDIQAVLTKASQLKAVLDGLGKLDWGNLTLDGVKAMALAGETIDQTFARIAGQMSAFDNAFLTDAQKLDIAKTHVKAVFDQLGIAIPASTADLVKLVHGLDLTTTAGQTFFNLIMSVFPDLQLLFQNTTTSTDNLGTTATNTANQVDSLNNSLSSMGGLVSDAEKSLGTFLKGLLQDNTLSPLGLDQKLALAKSDYQGDLQTGLRTASQIQQAQDDAKVYLGLAQQKYGGADYTAIFQQVYQQLSKYGIGNPSFNAAFNAKDAAASAVVKMNGDQNRLLTTLVSITDRRMSAVKDSVDKLTSTVVAQQIDFMGANG